MVVGCDQCSALITAGRQGVTGMGQGLSRRRGQGTEEPARRSNHLPAF